jgi:hypothetical protein
MSEEKKAIAYKLTPIYEFSGGMSDGPVICAATGDQLNSCGGSVGMIVTAHVIAGLLGIQKGWNDRDDDFTVSIDAAHPCLPVNYGDEGRWDREMRAREIVNNRHSKNALIDAVRWLMRRAERAEHALALIGEQIDKSLVDEEGFDQLRGSDGAQIGGTVATEVLALLRSFKEAVREGLGIPKPAAKEKLKAA